MGLTIMSCGAAGDTQPADAVVQAIVEGCKDEALEKAQGSGWNGLFTMFTAHSYKTQVVAGTNYFVKVQYAEGKFAHVRIFEALPHTGAAPAVHAIQVDLSEDTPLEYFE